MSKEINTSTDFIKGFDELSKSLENNAKPQWLKKHKTESLSRFQKLGIPTVKDEEWKYTSLSPILKNKFSLAKNNQLIETDAFRNYCNPNETNLVFVNGLFSPELSNLKNLVKGVTVSTIEEALTKNENAINAIVEKYHPDNHSTFVALNSAFTQNGAFIQIDDNVVSKALIHIVHVTSKSNGETLALPRTIISSGKSSQATVLESHICFNDDIVYFANALTDLYLGENATLHYCKAQKESLKAFHIGHTRVWQERNSNLQSISVIAGGAITRNNLDVVLNGEGINSTIDGLYSTYGEQHVDNHTSVDHRFPNCTSNQLYKGILNGSSRAVFNGKIFVRQIAQKTNSYQLNKNLLLGKNCRVDTKPQLEIFADDVKCTHGATVGQLDEDQLFYLQTRCIARETAIKMLARGFVDDLLNTVSNESINAKLHQLLEPSFAQL